MRSPRRVCSKGSSQTAHSLPTNVLSRRVRARSVEEAMTLLLIAPTLRELLLRPDRIELAEDSDRVKGGPKDALELVYPAHDLCQHCERQMWKSE
jgi:hypothetical protein